MNRLIVISAEKSFSGEVSLIHQLFEAGLSHFHLRKPGSALADYKRLLNQIDSAFHHQVVLHQFHELMSEFEVGGIHFPEKLRKEYSLETFSDLSLQFRAKGKTISTSFHDKAELLRMASYFDYVFFSPVFPSISKPGYEPKMDMHVQEIASATEIVGLGGIKPENVHQLQEMGYHGAALLGHIWNDPDKAVNNFKKMNVLWQKNVLSH